MLYTIPAYQSLDTILRHLLGTITTTQWETLIQANNLEWPYLVDGSEPTQFTASGTL